MTADEASIFDLDGLLVDSEVLWHRAELDLLVPLGAEIDASSTRTTKGMFVGEVVDHYQGLVGWSEPGREELIEQLLDRVGSLVETEGTLLPGALRALELCAGVGRVALASSTPRSLIDRVLAVFGLTDAFEVVHSAEDERFGKPDPAVYLTTARRLGVDPGRCLAFEDSPAGVRAATSAGMDCVAVPARDERGDRAFGLATVVLDSLADLDDAWLERRFGRSEATGSDTAPHPSRGEAR